MAGDLLRLPAQPDGVPWPTDEWPRGSCPPAVGALVDELFADEERHCTPPSGSPT